MTTAQKMIKYLATALILLAIVFTILVKVQIINKDILS